MKPIDLGKECPGPCEAPSFTNAPEKDKEVFYPTLFIEGGAELSKIPDEGTMLVRYCVKRRSEETARERNTLDLDIKQVLDVTEESSDKSEYKRSSDALDKLKDEAINDADE